MKIPAGEFSMGATGAWANHDELPVRRVRISEAFWMGKHEVTQGQWQAVMGSNPSSDQNCGTDCPVESVSWNDLQGFVARLNEREGGASYRLPTEAEWEYAAKAGTDTDTYAGDLIIHGNYDAPVLDGIAWYGGNSGVDYDQGYDCSRLTGKKQYASSRCGTHPVGQKAPNRFGLYDTLGNVSEWVQDWYGDYPGGSATDPAGPDSGSLRVVRGGEWYSSALYTRSTYRGREEPDIRFANSGVRLVRVDSTDPTADEYMPLDVWTVSDERMYFGRGWASGRACLSINGVTINGSIYIVHTSKRQMRANANSPWADIAGTGGTGMVCAYTPPPADPGQYRGVAEISIGGERGKYSTRNILSVGGAFQPQTVEVALGISGETVSLMTTEAGSFRLGDAPFNSGDTVTATNRNVYVLTLEDGAWTATYVLVEIVVALGASGETVTIARAEDGSVWLGEAVVASGDTVTASNGNEYRLTLGADGALTATLIADAQPTFGTAAVSNQTYTAGTPIAPLTLPAASGGDGNLTYSLVPSVPGLSFNASTRRLTGTPSSADTYIMTYTGRDADGDIATLNFTLTVVVRVLTTVDLVVASASASNTSPDTGQSFELRATVRNAGTGASPATTLHFYRSANTTISRSDTQVGSATVSALVAAGASSKAVTLTAPSTAGTYYYGACVDSVSGESNTQNNCSNAVTVSVTGSQVEAAASDFDLHSDNDNPNKITFANNRLFVVDWRDDKVYAYTASGQREPAADFDPHADTDNPSGITFANNRFFVPDSKDRRVYVIDSNSPNLVVQPPSVSDNTPRSGGSFVLRVTVRNRGTGASADTTLRFYRSADRTISTSDTPVGAAEVNAISRGSTSSREITLPAPTPEGTFYYGACVDPVPEESNTDDNCSSHVPVFGGGPFPQYDLVITRTALDAPVNATLGTEIHMMVEVTNRGPNTSQPATLSFSGKGVSVREFFQDIPALQPNENKAYSRERVGRVFIGRTTFRVCIIEAPSEESTDNNCASESVDYSFPP